MRDFHPACGPNRNQGAWPLFYSLDKILSRLWVQTRLLPWTDSNVSYEHFQLRHVCLGPEPCPGAAQSLCAVENATSLYRPPGEPCVNSQSHHCSGRTKEPDSERNESTFQSGSILGPEDFFQLLPFRAMLESIRFRKLEGMEPVAFSAHCALESLPN